MRDRLAAARIEDVAVAFAIELKKSLVITAGGQATAIDRDRGENRCLVARVLDPDHPGTAIGLGSQHPHVTCQVDVAMAQAFRSKHRTGPVGSVFLAEPAEIEFHTSLRQAHRLRFALDPPPADQLTQGIQVGRRRQTVIVEVPGPAQHARGDVEQAAAGLVQRVGVIQQRPGLFVASHRLPASRRVDARDDAVGLVARILGLDALDFSDRGPGHCLGFGLVVDRQDELAGTGHRLERDSESPHAPAPSAAVLASEMARQASLNSARVERHLVGAAAAKQTPA